MISNQLKPSASTKVYLNRKLPCVELTLCVATIIAD